MIEKFDNTTDEADEVVRGLRHVGSLVTITGQSGWVSADLDDDKFVETAVVARADVIVSGDRHLLALGTIEGIPIVNPREFLDRLTSEED